MIDRFKMAHKFRSLIGIWLVLIGSQLSGHLAQTSKPPTSISEPNTMITTAAYLDDSQLVNTIGNDDCGCLANYEIKISNDAMYTGQLIRCTNVRRFNHLSLISRLSAVAKCSQLEQQFNEIIITNNKFQHFNYTLLQHLNFTIKADLSHNEIEQIDKSSFSGLTSLKHLDLSGNRLKQLDSSLFDGLTSLVKLNLTGNQILNIDDFTFKSLSNLVILDLSLNHIVALRRNAFVGLNSLIQLNLASNYIQSLEDGVFDMIISKVRKIRLQNNQLICDCNLSWLIRAKDLYNKNLIGKVMCSPSHHQPRVKLSSVQPEHLVCANEVHLNHFEINVKHNVTKESGQRFEFDCKAIDGKQFQSIRFYRNDRLVAESTNYVNYLSDQFGNTSSLLSSKDLIEFRKSVINLNNFTKNSVEQKMIIHQLALSDAGKYECLVQTAFGNLSRRFELKVQPTNSTVYQQLIDLIKVPNSVMMFNSFLLALAVLIYLTNYGSIEMNSRLKYIQLHLWLQLLVLINLFHYSSTSHFSANRLNCELYGLLIYYLLVSILFTILLASIYLYKQLTKCTTTSLGGKAAASLDKGKRSPTNFSAFTNEHLTNPHLAAASHSTGQSVNQPYATQQYSPPQFNSHQHYNDELISEQILMYQRPARQSKSYCLQFTRFLFHHYTARYHALHSSLTTLVVLVFGLFNLNQFRTDSRCFANILLVSNFYVFVPLPMLIVGQVGMLVVVRCAIQRFHTLHKKLEQRDTVCVSLKAEHVLVEQHSTHVTSCLPCFRASSKLDMYWSSSAHCVAQLINFLFYLLLLALIILTVIDQDPSVFRNRTDDLSSLVSSPNTYWWLPSANLPPSGSSSGATGNQTDQLKSGLKHDRMVGSTNQTLESPGSVPMRASTPGNAGGLFDEQLLASLYLVCTFLLCGHILVHYCFARKDVREALKSMFVKTFCLYACDCCFKRRRCCNTQNQTNTGQPIRPDRFVNCTLVPGILNPNLDAQSSLLNFDQQPPKSSAYRYQQYAGSGYPGKQQSLLFEEKDEDDLYEQTDNDGQNVSSQLTTLDGLDLIQQSSSASNVLYRLANGNEGNRNAFKTMNAYQDGSSVTVRLLNDQMLSSESNSTTVTTGGSTASNHNFMCEQPLVTNGFANNGLLRNEMARNEMTRNGQKAVAPSSQFRQTPTTNKEHIYYETTASDQRYPNQKYMGDFKASFDDTFLEGDGTSYLQSAGEKAKSDIVVMNRARKLRKSSMNSKQKPRCIEVKYHQQPQLSSGGHLIMANNGSQDPSLVKLNQPHFTFGNFNQNGQMTGSHLRTNLPLPSAKGQITTKLERDFLSSQLKKYGSDNLDKIDYLPPVAKKIACKSEVMTTMSQPVTFLGHLGNNSKVHCRPGRHALLQKASLSTNNPHSKELNFSNLSSSYNSNFNNEKAPNFRKNRATTLNKSFLPTMQQNGALYKPLLVCGPNLSEKIDERFNDERVESHLAGDRVKENLYERIPCKKYMPEDARRSGQSGNQPSGEQQDSEDERYDNLDDCLANLNSNRLFLPSKAYANLPKTTGDELSELRNSPVLTLSNLTTNLSDLRNSSRNSPNFPNSSNLTNRSIKSNNSNRSIKSNHSNNSKKSSIASAHLAGSTSFPFPGDYNEPRADLGDRLNFSRSSTSTSKASDDVLTDNQSFNNSTASSNPNYSNEQRRRTDQFNLILTRNENGQMGSRLLESLEFSSCE